MATSFTCGSVGCYSLRSPSTHQVFKDLQSYLNRFSRVAGFTPVAVDGILGAGSLVAAQKTAQTLAKPGSSPAVTAAGATLIGLTATRELLATSAERVLSVLKLAASEAKLPAVSAPVQTLPVPTKTGIPEMPGFEFEPQTPHKAYYVAGALIGLVALFAGYHALKHKF